jgi:serine-type D-Ala-D-Ala carboxypeptidase/endopeptidase (penicillin-binding protein 4)
MPQSVLHKARRFKRHVPLLLVLAVSAATAAESVKQPANLGELQRQLSEYLAQPKYAAALWGVKVVSLDKGTVLFEHHAGKLFRPASNTKLYTAALALERLGPGYCIKTSLYARNKPDDSGTVSGNLIVYGRGDPTFSARMHQGKMEAALAPFVRQITNLGIKRIQGDLLADSSYFRGSPFGSGWLINDLQQPYGAEINALSIHDNIIQVKVTPGQELGVPCEISLDPATALLRVNNETRTGPKSESKTLQFRRRMNENILEVSGQMSLGDATRSHQIPFERPSELFAELLAGELKRNGIELTGKVRTVGWSERRKERMDFQDLEELGAVSSPPVRTLIREVLKTSHNLFANLLLAHIGEQRRAAEPNPEVASEELGIRELNSFLAKVGIPAGEVLFEEGSGLSRNNLTTPNATVTLLQFMTRQATSNVFFQALPVAGVDGTLHHRMKGTVAENNVRAKTGTLKRDSSLSGRVQTAAGEHLIFSVMLNHYLIDPVYPGKDLDAIAIMLSEYKGNP